MAIYGIGAMYDGDWDVSGDFVTLGVACIGWDITDSPSLHEMLKLFRVGDIVYIKTAPIGQGLRVKSVGVVTNNQAKSVLNSFGKSLGTGVDVKWVWKGYHNLGTINDKYNVRNNTLYEEFNPDVQKSIINFLLYP